MQFEDMKAKIEGGNGFIAALDQSGGSTPKALKGYGIEEDAWTNEEEMFGLIHHAFAEHHFAGLFGREGAGRHPVRTHHGR